MISKKKYNKLDEVGFVGTQKEQSAASKKYHAQKTSEFFKSAKKTKRIAVVSK